MIVKPANRAGFNREDAYLVVIYAAMVLDAVLINMGIYAQNVFVVFVFAISLALPPEKILVEMMLVAPASSLLKLADSYTVMTFLALLVVVKMLMKCRKVDKEFLASFVLMAGLCVVSSLLQYSTFMPCVAFLTYFLMVYLATRVTSLNEAMRYKMAICFVATLMFVCIGSQLLPHTVDLVSNKGEYTVRNCGFSSVWDFGMNLTVAVCMLMFSVKAKRISPLLAIPFVVIFGYFIATTGLYTAIVGLVALFVVLPFVDEDRSRKITVKKLAVALLVVLAILCVYYVLVPYVEAMRNQTSDNGRFEIWTHYLSLFSSNPKILLIGVGGGSIGEYAASIHALSAHNILIEKLLEFGLLGLVFLAASVVSIYRNAEINPFRNYYMAVLFVFLVMGLTQGSSGSEVLFLLMILAYRKSESSRQDC